MQSQLLEKKIVTALIAILLVLLLSACSKVLEVNITFNTNAGEISGAGQYVRGSEVILRAKAEEGYEFVAWEENGEIVSIDDTYVFEINTRRNLTALFEEKGYLVELISEDQEKGSVQGGGTFSHGENTTIIAIPNKGYMFVGWAGLDSYQAKEEIEVSGDMRLTALFDEAVESAIYNYGAAPVLSPNGNFLAYFHEQALLIYSLTEDKIVLEIRLNSTAQRDYEEIKLVWLQDSEGLIVLDGNEMVMYRFNEDNLQITHENVKKVATSMQNIFILESVDIESTDEEEINFKLKILDFFGEVSKEEVLTIDKTENTSTEIISNEDGSKLAMSIGKKIFIYNISKESFHDLSKEVSGEVLSWVMDNKVAFLDHETRSFQVYDLKKEQRLMLFNMREVDLVKAHAYFLGDNYLLVRGSRRDNSEESYYINYEVIDELDDLEMNHDIKTEVNVLTAAKRFDQILKYQDRHILSADNKLVAFDKNFNPKLLYQAETRVEMLGVIEANLIFLEANRTNFYSLIKQVAIEN